MVWQSWPAVEIKRLLFIYDSLLVNTNLSAFLLCNHVCRLAMG